MPLCQLRGPRLGTDGGTGTIEHAWGGRAAGVGLQVRWYKDAIEIAKFATVIDAGAAGSRRQDVHETEAGSGDGAGEGARSAGSPQKRYHGWLGFVRRMCNEPAPSFNDVQADAGAVEIPAAYVELATLGCSQFCGEYGCLTGVPRTWTPAALHGLGVSHSHDQRT